MCAYDYVHIHLSMHTCMAPKLCILFSRLYIWEKVRSICSLEKKKSQTRIRFENCSGYAVVMQDTQTFGVLEWSWGAINKAITKTLVCPGCLVLECQGENTIWLCRLADFRGAMLIGEQPINVPWGAIQQELGDRLDDLIGIFLV